jgi:hypothetical protein
MKKNLSAVIAGAGMPFAVSLIVGMTEPILRNEYASWNLTVMLCAVWVIGLLFAEKKWIQAEQPKWGGILVLSGIPAMVILWFLMAWYLSNLYNKVNAWDHSFLAGLQWVVYLITMIGAYVLWVIVRVIIGAVRMNAERKRQQ